MTGTFTSDTIEVVADPVALYELSMAQGWGDGHPLLPPTEERVADLLTGSSLAPDHVITEAMHPGGGAATIEKVAINAAMAGCLPAHLPFVIAGVEAINMDGYNLHGVGATTGAAFQYLLVNGPSRDELDVDYGYSCMGGAGGRGSTTIGRAVALCLRNIGGQRAGLTTKSCFGQPARVGTCFGEWEEVSPWPSLAEQLGFSRDEDVVHAHAGMGTLPLTYDTGLDHPRDLAYLLARSMAFPAGNKMLPSIKMQQISQVVLAINPDWANAIAGEFPDVEDFKQFLLENSWQPIDLFPDSVRDDYTERADENGRVHLSERPDQFRIMVCGGQVSLHAICLPSWGPTEMQSRLVARHGG